MALAGRMKIVRWLMGLVLAGGTMGAGWGQTPEAPQPQTAPATPFEARYKAAYQRTIAIEPNYAPAYLNLGVLYDLYMSQPQKALEQFEHYLTLAGENKQVAGWIIELRKRVGPAAPAVKKEPA